MDKIIAIIKREYLTRVRTKGFVIATILSPLLMMSFIIVPVLIARRGSQNDLKLVVLDQTSDAALMTRPISARISPPPDPSEAIVRLVGTVA